MSGYKVWHCRYRWSGGFGAYQDCDCIVIAEIESKALGMALMEYPNTHASGWSASEIPQEKEGVHHINEASS